jgi:hypothetical protein
MQAMFTFRAAGEIDPVRWSTILEPSITLVLPITPYRSFPPLEVFLMIEFSIIVKIIINKSKFLKVMEGQRHIKGIQGIILDTASFSLMIQSIGTHHDKTDKV